MPITNDAIALGEKLLSKKNGASLGSILKARQNEIDSNYRNAVLAGDSRRQMTAFLQLEAKDANIDSGVVDGLWGHVTANAVEELEHLQANGIPPAPWREAEAVGVTDNVWPTQNETKLNTFYGAVGTNQTLITPPYDHFLAWDPGTKARQISCNKKVAKSLEEVLAAVLAHYGKDRIRELRLDQFGGCLNVRRMRGGSSWSMHAWGIALDYDPDNNQLKWGRNKATFSKPAYDKWWSIWEDAGWSSLGRRKDYDWMHVQAAVI